MKKQKKRIFHGARSTLVDSCIIESGRAEQSTKVFGIEFVDAHGPTGLL